jgi:hypothetical protein
MYRAKLRGCNAMAPIRAMLNAVEFKRGSRMLNRETQAQIRHLFYAEHWKIGTIAQQLGVHPDAVRRAVQTDSFHPEPSLRPCLTDPYVEFVRTTLEKYPRLRATRIFQMVRDRGYPGSAVQLRRLVARLRPVQREAFLRLAPFPGEQAQADWAYFGEVQVGRARRRLSCFLITLSYSRALYLEFFFDQTLEICCEDMSVPLLLVRRAPYHTLRQHAQCSVRAARGCHPLSSAASGILRSLPLPGPTLRGACGKSKRARGAIRTLCAGIVLGRP